MHNRAGLPSSVRTTAAISDRKISPNTLKSEQAMALRSVSLGQRCGEKNDGRSEIYNLVQNEHSHEPGAMEAILFPEFIGFVYC
jgi:hypothetical protein